MNLLVEYKDNKVLTNFEDLKIEVQKEVEKYSVEVTEENIPEAKKVMANMNKVKGELSSKYKHHIDIYSQPINQLKFEKKELEAIISQGRQKIADSVATFEVKKLEIAKEEILKYLDGCCKEKDINVDAIQVLDLVKLSSITAKGTLTKTTKEQIDNRISLLENEILKARLEAEEKAKRDRDIADKAREEERERSFEREKQRSAQAEIDKQKAVEEAKVEVRKEVIEKKIPENVVVIEKVKPKEADDGKMIYTVVATFEVKATKGIAEEKIINALESKMVAAGITTCKEIKVM